MTLVPADTLSSVTVVFSGEDAVSDRPEVDGASVTVCWVPVSGETVVWVSCSVVGPEVIVSVDVDIWVVLEKVVGSVGPSEEDTPDVIACVAGVAVDMSES